jgi:hypothetical protein
VFSGIFKQPPLLENFVLDTILAFKRPNRAFSTGLAEGFFKQRQALLDPSCGQSNTQKLYLARLVGFYAGNQAFHCEGIFDSVDSNNARIEKIQDLNVMSFQFYKIS